MQRRTPKLRTTLAQCVRRERNERGWSQEQLAIQAGTTQSYISQIESASRAVSIDVVEDLARAFGINPLLLLAH